jgi:hypothetical protein
MTTLKNLKGTAIQFLDADPVEYVGTWASGGNMNVARGSGGAAGVTTAGMIAGGDNPGSGYLANHEYYNGSAWSEQTDLSTARRYPGGGGTQTASLIMGGAVPPGDSSSNAVEQWNGSSWTEIAEMNQGRRLGRASTSGTTTAMLLFQGSDPGPGGLGINNVELWNGSSWTEVNEMNTLREGSGSNGVSTSAIAAAGLKGDNPGGTAPFNPSNVVESWNGSSWTEVSEVNTSRSYTGGGGTSNTSAVIFGGGQPVPSNGVKTEQWDGSSWTEVNDLAEGVNCLVNGSGSATDALKAGGSTTAAVTTTEEWTFPAITTSILQEGDMWFNSTSSTLKGYGTAAGLPAATWASGGNLNVAKSSAAGAGTQTAGIFMGGRGSPPSNTVYAQTELYNGSTWTEVNDMNTGRYSLSGANSGSQTATLAFGGYDTAILAVTESWDGTNWTEVNDLNTAGSSGSGFGTQTAAIFTGGDNRSYNKTESWNGTSWTETTDLNTARAQMAGFGIATAGLICGGDLYPVTSPTRLAVQTELWDGSSWTETGDLNTGRRRIGNGGFGTQTSGLTAGGYTTTYVANTETWNGTSWTERTEIQTRDNTTGVGGGGPLGFIAGGGTSPGAASNATEEWTAPAVVSTVTTS